MQLTAKQVDETFMQCLFHENEVVEGKPVVEPVYAEAIVCRYYGFHPTRLEQVRETVREMLAELSDKFHQGGGGGASFLEGYLDKHERHWGEQRNVEQLVSLGIALGLASYCFPRDMWRILPGSVPYFVVDLKGDAA